MRIGGTSRAGLAEREAKDKRSTEVLPQLQAITDAVRDVLYVVDPSGKLSWWNARLEHITGLSKEELTGKPAVEFFPPEQHGLVAESIQRVFDEGSAEAELDLITRAGPIPYHFNGVSLQDTDGRVVGLAGVGRDISERRQTQEAGQLWSQISTSFLQAMSDLGQGVGVIESGRLVYFNDALSDITGYTREELLALPSFLSLVAPDQRDGLAERISRRRNGEQSLDHAETVGIHKNGQLLQIEFSLKSISLAGNLQYLAIIRDVSAKKRAEEAALRESASVKLLQSIAVVANGAESVSEALQFAVDRVCAHTGWPIGHVYIREEASGDFVSAGIWSSETSELFGKFREASEATGFGATTGLPGWVAATGKPAWIKDVARQPRFGRAKLAAETGVRAGFAFPVLVGREVVAVLEFFSTEVEEPDENLLEVMAHVGTQLGRVIERKRAEQHLRRSEDRFRGLVESSPEAIAVYADNERIVLANAAAAKLIGASSPDELVDKTVWDFVHPEDRGVISQRGRRLAKGKGILPPAELRFVRLDGEEVVVESIARKVSFEGRPAVQVSARDITERRRMQAALGDSEERYRLLFQESPVALWEEDFTEVKRYCDVLRRKGVRDLHRYFDRRPEAVAKCREMVKVMAVNAATLRLYEAETADAFAGGIGPTLIEESFDAFKEELVALASGETFFEAKAVTSALTGRRLDITLRCRVAPGHENTLSRIFVSALPTEELRHAEQVMARLVRDLERTRQDLEQFAYVASHDLQEPLRMVSSYLQLIERRYKGRLDGDADDFINFAVDGARRMQNLISDLLAYSRIGTRGKPFGPTDFNEVLDGVVASLKEALESAGAKLTRDPLPALIADATQVEQLFQQMIGNAVKFRGGRRPRIHVGAKEIDGEWVFSVRDNGIGIDPRYAERIFVIFQRLHGRDEYPGTGMGLAICKRIVERRGGRIWVESEPGKGATFYFTMPQRGANRIDRGG
jgi:PAS domain S-box-containing protein